MSDSFKEKLNSLFPNMEFSREIPAELKNNTTITMRVNSSLVDLLKELARERNISYQALIKEILWNYIDHKQEGEETPDDRVTPAQRKIIKLLGENNDTFEEFFKETKKQKVY